MAVFIIFATKIEINIIYVVTFYVFWYKEAKNKKLVVTIKKKYNYEKVNDDPDGSHDRHRSKCTVQHLLLQ